MEPDDAENAENPAGLTKEFDDQDSRSALNSLILDYYKKFGRNRDLEQYFSLSTAQSEIRDPSSLFWRRLKMQHDTSDSGEKPSESSTELCRISVQCTIPVESSSQDEQSNSKIKSDTESPPIITDEAIDHSVHSENESVKSEDNHSHKSVDLTLDTSLNKPASPTSSITSQRRLEWDSLADVGYANESERKTSGSSLSTLERLALLQQYSNNDNKSNDIGPPTAHSTMIDPSTKSKADKRGLIKRTRELHSKNVDVVKLNVPQSSDQKPQSISVNLTRHISFNVEKDGAVSVENVNKNIKVESPDKVPMADETPDLKFDKEIQTSLTKSYTDSKENHKSKRGSKIHYAPIFFSLNTLRRRMKKRYTRTARKKSQKSLTRKQKRPIAHEKREQVSEAESFEYMPGHIYNQNIELNDDNQTYRSSVGNKSSLESSGITTESSKSNVSFTKDLDNSVKLLNAVLKRHKDNANLKNKLVKDIVQKLVKSRYMDDESTTDFLSGFSYSSKRLGLGEDIKHYTTTSTSDANNTVEKKNRPKKSILRMDKFNANVVASTSQSAPNLPIVSNSEKPIVSKFPNALISSCTESDISSKAKDSSATDSKIRTSSEELYRKYLDAVKREDAYKKHLRDKERFMREKLLGSDNVKSLIAKTVKSENNRLRDLMKDLTSKNFDNGSGDASKSEKPLDRSSKDIEKFIDVRKFRSHSVFTLSSGNSEKCSNAKDKERETRKLNLRKRLQEEIEASCSTPQGAKQPCNFCCNGGAHGGKCIHIGDGKVQLKIHGLTDKNIKDKTNKCSMQTTSCNREKSKPPSDFNHDKTTGDIKYFYCVCSESDNIPINEVSDNVMVYKCSRLINKGVQLEVTTSNASNDASVQCSDSTSSIRSPRSKEFVSRHVPSSKAIIQIHSTGTLNINKDGHDKQCKKRNLSEASQTNIALNILDQISSDRNVCDECTNVEDSLVSCKETPDGDDSLKNKYILVVTRCMQTEISINPNITEPSLSDVKMLYDSVCTKVSENYIKIESKLTSKKNSYNVSQDNCETQMTPRKDIFCNKPCETKDQMCSTSCQAGLTTTLRDTATQSNICLDEINVGMPCETINSNVDNYTIPLQGTNMTLMVSFSAKNSTLPTVDSIKDISENNQIDHLNDLEKDNSLAEECSVGVQYEAVTMEGNKEINSSCPFPKNIESKKLNVNFDSETNLYEKNTHTVNTCFKNTSFKRSTYPKAEKKTSVHRNTESVLLRKYSDDQILYNSKPFNSQKPQPLETLKKDMTNLIRNDNAIKEAGSSRKSSKFEEFTSSEEQLRSTNYQSSRHRTAYESVISSNDPILDTIQNITNRFTKTPKEKGKREKCFKEIMKVLKFLLETEETTDACLPTSTKDTPEIKENKKSSAENFSTKIDDSSPHTCVSFRTKDGEISSTSLKTDSEFKSIKNDSSCVCGCGGRDECIRESSPSNTKPNSKLKSLSASVHHGIKDPGGQSECKIIPTVPSKHSFSPFKGSPRSNSSSPRRDIGRDCACDDKRYLVSKSSAKTKKDLKSNPSCVYKSTHEDCGGQGECLKSISKSKDVKTCACECKLCKCESKNHIKERSKHGNNKKDVCCGIEHDLKTVPRKSSSRCKGCGEHNTKDRKGSQTSSKKELHVKSCSGVCECGCGTEDNCYSKSKKGFHSSSSETDRTSKPHMGEKKVKDKACQCDCKSVNCNKTKCKSKSSAYFPTVLPKENTDNGIQQSCYEDNDSTGLSDSLLPCSSHHDTSDAVTCDILNKIKNECERYHQTRCKLTHKYGESSTASDNGCHRNHFCTNKILQKCRVQRMKSGCEKYQKKCVAYNLLLQTSESLADEEGHCFRKQKQLQNVIVKVPSKRANICRGSTVEEPTCSRAGKQGIKSQQCRMNRPSSWPNESELSSTDDYKRAHALTCKDYLERNRPDFIENASARLNCLKIINETRANERDAKRKLLSLQLERGATLSSISATDIRHLAKELGLNNYKTRKPSPKFISEREMKKHSENIYKSLPEVTKKKEELKKVNIKKTNLLMAKIFKKNLQKKTLKGSVNLSNYSAVIKI